jgi:predicted PurR-regulated permease PerM
VLIGPRLSDQFRELGSSLAGGLDALRAQMEASPLLRPFLGGLGAVEQSGAALAQRAAGVFATALGALGAFAVIVFIGAYLALDPGLYQRGALHLVRKHDRPRGQEVLSSMGRALRSWLFGQFVSMCLVGAMVTAGLLLIGVPLALPLGLLAFFLEFVPYLGPIAAFVPIVLVALAESPQLALYAVLLYGVVQFVESYFILPLVQKRVVDLPPALLLFFQVLLGTLGGLLGVIVSAPLGVAVIVLVQMLYVEDVLGDDVAVLGEDTGNASG